MKTLIELYDEKRPLENVLSTEVFRPERTVFVCPPNVARNAVLQKKLREYFAHRGVQCQLDFEPASLLNAAEVEITLRGIFQKYEDCALDIAGGTDAALFAGGMMCAGTDVPVFTYSRRRNRFYSIRGAKFADNLPCEALLTIEDCLLMAGGSMRSGRVDNGILSVYREMIDPFFRVYMSYRRDWTRIVTYIQRVSQQRKDEAITLTVEGPYVARGEHGSRATANDGALRALEKIEMIRNLQIVTGERVSFEFRDTQVRTWLRDIGSVLELYVYKTCQETGLYQDVRTSVVVDWQGENKPDAVTNEIDVMAAKGVIPVFISCKTCDVKTEALNELAVLRDRFGGEIARAAIVTAEPGRPPMRHRAMELGIDVIDLNDLRSGQLRERLSALAR